MRFLAPPSRGPIDNTVMQGSNQFVNVGCARCHTVTLQTGASPFPALANQTIHPYSDFALHHMGPGLADQISQGLAGGDEFRTAPLWGLGQRLFFLHDGRTSDLLEAIREHSSARQLAIPGIGGERGGEELLQPEFQRSTGGSELPEIAVAATRTVISRGACYRHMALKHAPRDIRMAAKKSTM